MRRCKRTRKTQTLTGIIEAEARSGCGAGRGLLDANSNQDMTEMVKNNSEIDESQKPEFNVEGKISGSATR